MESGTRGSEFVWSIQGCLPFLRRVWGHSKAGSPSRKGPPCVTGIRDLFFFFHAWCHRDQVLPEQKRSVWKACPSTPSVSDCPCSPLDSLMHTALGPVCPSFPLPLSTAAFFAQSLHLSSIHLPLWEGGWC